MLLGLPWLFDRKVTHNGCLNTILTKDGKKVTLTSLTPSQLQKAKPQKTQHRLDLLLACSEPILKASQHELRAFKDSILATAEEIKPLKPAHPLAISLLRQFTHLFPEEIPTGLPLKRDLQH